MPSSGSIFGKMHNIDTVSKNKKGNYGHLASAFRHPNLQLNRPERQRGATLPKL
jgi:hypothetical protein